MTKNEIAKKLNISRKTLYNYMNELGIKDLNGDNIEKIKLYSLNKNKTKEFSKIELLKQLEDLKIKNAELEKQNNALQNGNDVLLNQLEWYKNVIDNDIRVLKDNMTLLLNPPVEQNKKSIFKRIFKR